MILSCGQGSLRLCSSADPGISKVGTRFVIERSLPAHSIRIVQGLLLMVILRDVRFLEEVKLSLIRVVGRL